MNWVGKSQGCPEAVKAAGMHMGCLLETGRGWYGAHNCSVHEPPPDGDVSFLAQQSSACPPPPARVSESKAFNRYSSHCLLLRLKSGLTRNL